MQKRVLSGAMAVSGLLVLACTLSTCGGKTTEAEAQNGGERERSRATADTRRGTGAIDDEPIDAGPRRAAEERQPSPPPPDFAEPTTSTLDAGRPEVVVGDAGSADETNDPPTREADCGSLRPFDPGEVYILGTLSEGACYLNAISHWAAPNTALVGFGCYTDSRDAVVDPSTGDLVFSETFDQVYRFREDGCVTGEGDLEYPDDPLDNDGLISFPCEHDGVRKQVLVAPDGSLALTCGGEWFAEDGEVVYAGTSSALAFAGSWLLTMDGVVDIATGSELPFVGLPNFDPLAVRVHEAGFWLVLPGEDAMNEPGLWNVDWGGQAMLVGTYPPPPERAAPSHEPAKLDLNLSLFQIAQDEDEVFNDLIIRRTTAGVSEIVYDELSDPLVKLHISGLVTGP